MAAGVDKVLLPMQKVAGNNWTCQGKFGQQLDPLQKWSYLSRVKNAILAFCTVESDKNSIKYPLQHSPCECLYLLLLTPTKQGLGNNWTHREQYLLAIDMGCKHFL